MVRVPVKIGGQKFDSSLPYYFLSKKRGGKNEDYKESRYEK